MSELSAECLVLGAGRILQFVGVRFSGQEDAQLHHLLQHHGGQKLHGDVIVQLYQETETQLHPVVECKKKNTFTKVQFDTIVLY